MKPLEGTSLLKASTWSSLDHFRNLQFAFLFLLAARQFWCCAGGAGKHKFNG